jgi:hypothetical protein
MQKPTRRFRKKLRKRVDGTSRWFPQPIIEPFSVGIRERPLEERGCPLFR